MEDVQLIPFQVSRHLDGNERTPSPLVLKQVRSAQKTVTPSLSHTRYKEQAFKTMDSSLRCTASRNISCGGTLGNQAGLGSHTQEQLEPQPIPRPPDPHIDTSIFTGRSQGETKAGEWPHQSRNHYGFPQPLNIPSLPKPPSQNHFYFLWMPINF